MIEGILSVWILHVFCAALLSYPFVRFGWKRAGFQQKEARVFVVPYAVWAATFLVNEATWNPKSLSNLAIEPLWLSIGIAVAAAVRVILGRRWPVERMAKVTLALLCAAAFAIDTFTSGWPE